MLRIKRKNEISRRYLLQETLEDRRLMDTQLSAVLVDAGDDVVTRQLELAVESSSFNDSLVSNVWIPPQQHTPLPWPEGVDHFDTEAKLREFLIDWSVTSNQHLFGQNVYGQNRRLCGPFLNFDPSVVLFSSNSTNVTQGIDDTTNVQISKVDEADIVETDGNYLYLLSGTRLTIVDIRSPDDLQVRSRIDLHDFGALPQLLNLSSQSSPHQMYLQGDFLMVVSNGNGTAMDVRTIDVSDRANPKIVRTDQIDGTIVTSRAIDGTLHLVVRENRIRAPGVRYMGDSNTGARYESEAGYRARLEDMSLSDFLPGVRSDVDDRTSIVPFRSVEEIDASYLADAYFLSSATSTVVISMEIGSTNSPDILNVLDSHSSEVFVSQDSMYLFTSRRSTTEVTKLALADGKVQYAAKGIFEGTLLNRFSVGEHNGNLQVATTTGRFGHSNVYVLDQIGESMEVIGKVEDIAPGERIYSARFMGDRAYVVTFQKVDPLFVLDMSDGTKPTIVGELKMPGYSEYLQPYGDNHIIGIGRNADASTGRFQELQISLFDVSTLDDPKLVDKYSFGGGRSSSSEATIDPHAIGLFLSHNVLAIPLNTRTEWFGNGRGGADDTPLFFDNIQSALPVFHIDVDTGFEVLGRIGFEDQVRRTVQVGDVMYAISNSTIKAHALDEVAKQFDQIDYAHADLVKDADEIVEVGVQQPAATTESALSDVPVPSQSEATSMDINGDGRVTNVDALLIRRYLHHQSEEDKGRRVAELDAIYDVDGDGFVAPGDFRQVLNYLNAR